LTSEVDQTHGRRIVLSLTLCYIYKKQIDVADPLSTSYQPQDEAALVKTGSATYAAVDEVPIDKGDWHLIFPLSEFKQGICIHS